MKTFEKFLQEKIEYPPLELRGREEKFPQPSGCLFQDRQYPDRFYLIEPQVAQVDGCEWWVKGTPVSKEGDTLTKQGRDENVSLTDLQLPGTSASNFKYVIGGY